MILRRQLSPLNKVLDQHDQLSQYAQVPLNMEWWWTMSNNVGRGETYLHLGCFVGHPATFKMVVHIVIDQTNFVYFFIVYSHWCCWYSLSVSPAYDSVSPLRYQQPHLVQNTNLWLSFVVKKFRLFSVVKIVCRQLLLRVTPLYYLANPLPVLQPLLVLPTCDYCPVVLPQLPLSKL